MVARLASTNRNGKKLKVYVAQHLEVKDAHTVTGVAISPQGVVIDTRMGQLPPIPAITVSFAYCVGYVDNSVATRPLPIDHRRKKED